MHGARGKAIRRGVVSTLPCQAGFLVMAVLLAVGAGSRAADEGDRPGVGDVAQGARIYRVHCAMCHGFSGSGDGPAASALKTPPANHTNGSLMNARDNQMIFRTIQLGCQGMKCSGEMPPFAGELDQLNTWDLVAYLRSLHLPLTAFFSNADQYLVKEYTIGELGDRQFKEGQMERLKNTLKKVDSKELTKTVFTLFRSQRGRVSPELVPQEPRRLAQLSKGNKIGYVFFMDFNAPRVKKIPIGLALDTNYTIVKLVAAVTDTGPSKEYGRRFGKYVGLGKRGDLPDFNISRSKPDRFFDEAVTRVYMLAVEAANAYELEERERSWADGTF